MRGLGMLQTTTHSVCHHMPLPSTCVYVPQAHQWCLCSSMPPHPQSCPRQPSSSDTCAAVHQPVKHPSRVAAPAAHKRVVQACRFVAPTVRSLPLLCCCDGATHRIVSVSCGSPTAAWIDLLHATANVRSSWPVQCSMVHERGMLKHTYTTPHPDSQTASKQQRLSGSRRCSHLE